MYNVTMEEKIDKLISHIKKVASNPQFIHHQWFIKWHLEIVARIADELVDHYPEADRTFVKVMAWMHDYGKIINFDKQYETTRPAGKAKMLELGFDESFAEQVISYIETMDKKLEIDISQAPIEVQIVSSADGCAHLGSPFMAIWLYENPTRTIEELMAGNVNKINKDWEYKIVLLEAKKAFAELHDASLLQNGELPDKFL